MQNQFQLYLDKIGTEAYQPLSELINKIKILCNHSTSVVDTLQSQEQ